jgi:hypothetical protein
MPTTSNEDFGDDYTIFVVRYPTFEPAVRVGSVLFLGPPDVWEGSGLYVIEALGAKPILVRAQSIGGALQYQDHQLGMWHSTSREHWSAMKPRAVGGFVSYCSASFRGFLESRFPRV